MSPCNGGKSLACLHSIAISEECEAQEELFNKRRHTLCFSCASPLRPPVRLPMLRVGLMPTLPSGCLQSSESAVELLIFKVFVRRRVCFEQDSELLSVVSREAGKAHIWQAASCTYSVRVPAALSRPHLLPEAHLSRQRRIKDRPAPSSLTHDFSS